MSNRRYTLLAGALRRSVPPRVRVGIRRQLTRLDNPELRNARKLLKRMRTNPPAVLYLGDSTSLFVDPEDADQRRLWHMICDGLAPRDVHVIAGGGYGPELHAAYLRLLEGTPARPLVLHSLCFRVLEPLIEHPAYGKRKELAAIQRIDPATPSWRIRAMIPRPTQEEFERFYELPHHTLLGELKVGDYVRPLKNGGLAPDEHMRLIYGYHHGADLSRSRGIEAVTRLGRCLRELGCRTVAYQTPVPLQTGVEIFGAAFEELVVENWRVMEAAYREGLGREAAVLQTGTIFAPEEFIDPADGTEHLNEEGRRRLAETIVDAVEAELERD